MLGALLKYEYKATSRMLLPICGGLVLVNAMWALTGLLVSALDTGSGSWSVSLLWFLNALLGMLFALTVLASFVMTAFICLRQFYRLLGEDGYLLFTLPAHPSEHMTAKLLCGVGWFFALCVLYDLLDRLDALIMARDAAASALPQPLDIPASLAFLGLALLGITGAILFCYLCMVIGTHWPQQRLAASVIAYFGLSFAGQAALVAGAFALVEWLMDDPKLLQSIDQSVGALLDAAPLALGHQPLFWYAVGAGAVVLLALDAALWAVVRYRLVKHLNIV